MGVESDRELLELAAKAAGYIVTGLGGMSRGVFVHRKGAQPDDCGDLPNFHWDPLTEDGDALRLACVLGLTVECDFHDSDTCTAYQTRGEIVADEQSGMVGEIIDSPEFAASRRAIVRAAAEIGRAM